MAGKIRGISIELSADTTGLVKGLKSADSAIRTTQKELRDINRLLKLDPTNMTLLKQKTQALQTQVAQTSDKLKKLKEIEKQMKSEGIDQNSEQFKALQREIIATEQELKKLEGTAGSGSAKMLQISEATKKVGESAEKVGKKMMKVTAAITAVGAVSIKAFTEVDNGYDEMIKKTGATGEAAEELRGIMNNLATEIPTDFETAGKAVGEVSTRFGVTGEQLEQLSSKFIKFADLNNTDVSGSIDKVQKALAAYGLGADDADAYLDRLNYTAQNTGVSVEKLAEGIVTNGTAFQEMGLSIDQATAFMGQLEKSGANSETVLNGMRKALKKATKEGKPLNKALEDLQDTIENGKDGVDGLTAAYDLFGKSGDQIYSAVKNGTVNFKNLGKVAATAAGNIESTFEETLDPVDKFKMTLNGLKITGAELGSTILSMLAPAIQKLTEFAKKLAEKWRGLDDNTKKMIVTIAGVVAAVGPAVLIFGKVATAISGIAKAMSTLKFASFITNPVTLAIGVLAGLTAGVVALSKKIRDSNATMQAYDEQLDTMTGKNQTLKNDIDATNKALEENVTQADANAGAAERLAGKLDTLMQKEEKTAADKETIKTLVEQLNELVPTLGLAYDAEADSLNKTNKQIQDNIELVKEQARLAAYTDAYTQSVKQAAQAEMDLGDAQETFNDMMAEAPQELQNAIKYYQEFGDEAVRTSKDHSAAYLKYADDYQRLKQAADNVTAAQQNLNTATQQSDKWFDKMSDATEELADSQAKFSMSNVREEFKRTFGAEYTNELDSALKKAEAAGVEIPEKLATNLTNGKHSVEYATKRINDLVKFEEAKKRALEDGIGIPTEAYKGMMKASGKVTEANTSVNRKVTLEEAKRRALEDGFGIPSNVAEGIQSGEYKVASAAASVATTARTNASADGTDLGNTFGISYGDGIEAELGYVAAQAEKLALRARNAVQAAQNSGSPSKVAMALGDDFGEGYVLGLLDKVKDAGRAAKQLVSAPSTARLGFSSIGALSTPTGVVNNYTYNQTNNSPRALTPSEIYRQSKNLLNAKGGVL